jgi:thiol-disulfide isomerase/thioredoxin
VVFSTCHWFLIVAIGALIGCDQARIMTEKPGALKSAKATLAAENAAPPVYGSEQISQIQESDFGSFFVRKNALVIVDFHLDWCGPCKMSGSVLEDATKAHPGARFVVGAAHAHPASRLHGGDLVAIVVG